MTATASAHTSPDYGTPFLHAHFLVELEGDATGRGQETHHAIVRDGHILDKLKRHGSITDVEWAAGIHLSELAQRAGFLRYATIRFDEPQVDGRNGSAEAGIGSREAFRRAIDALPVPLRQPITVVVIESRPIVAYERAAAFRAGTGLGALRIGLQCLAGHFGLGGPRLN